MTDRPWAYSAFPVEVAATVRLSPGFVRLTLRGEALRDFAPWGVDQRIKIVLPLPGTGTSGGTGSLAGAGTDAPAGDDPAARFGLADFGLLDEPTPHPSEWYARWRGLAGSERNVLRTYTPSAIRPALGEIDVDFYLHEPAGPASAWAATARPGDPVVITGPDIRMGWTGYGIHWQPGDATRFLLVADETALPALRNILRTLRPDARVDAVLELGDPADEVLPADVAPGLAVRVVPRGEAEAAVGEWIAQHRADGDDEFAVWLAGESGVVTRIRRLLTAEAGIAKERISFLGYWRHGGPLVG